MKTVKFDDNTLSILKNFSSINQSLLFKPGSFLATISPTKTIMARANVDLGLESTFAIYDMSKFLSAMSLFTAPELIVNDKFLTMQSDGRKLNYTFADPSLIVSPPDKEIKLPSVDVEFELKNEVLTTVLKASGVLALPEISVLGEDGVISICATDSKNPSGDVYSIEVGNTENAFRAIFKTENLKMIPGDYDVKISSKGISCFTGRDVEYFVAVESNSSF